MVSELISGNSFEVTETSCEANQGRSGYPSVRIPYRAGQTTYQETTTDQWPRICNREERIWLTIRKLWYNKGDARLTSCVTVEIWWWAIIYIGLENEALVLSWSNDAVHPIIWLTIIGPKKRIRFPYLGMTTPNTTKSIRSQSGWCGIRMVVWAIGTGSPWGSGWYEAK